MTWICSNCGNHKEFKGYIDITEWGTDRATFNNEGGVIDTYDHEINDGETNDSHIEICAKCNTEDITFLCGKEFKEWKKTHFDLDGNFIKDIAKDSKIISVDKLIMLNDELLSDKISIEEYRQRKTKIVEASLDGKQSK